MGLVTMIGQSLRLERSALTRVLCGALSNGRSTDVAIGASNVFDRAEARSRAARARAVRVMPSDGDKTQRVD
jgi:hypothetical protein